MDIGFIKQTEEITLSNVITLNSSNIHGLPIKSIFLTEQLEGLTVQMHTAQLVIDGNDQVFFVGQFTTGEGKLEPSPFP